MKTFENYKKEAMKKLEEAKKEDKVDRPAYSILDVINSKEHYFTTSSCSGRILMLKGGENKKESSFYAKWHRKVEVEEVKNAIENYKDKEPLWFRVQPFIFHVIARDTNRAFDFVEVARRAGVKRIGVQRIKYAYLIELYGTESLAVPLNICNCDLEKLVEFSNKKMENNEKRLKKLEFYIKKYV